jgi:hypothetical protein
LSALELHTAVSDFIHRDCFTDNIINNVVTSKGVTSIRTPALRQFRPEMENVALELFENLEAKRFPLTSVFAELQVFVFAKAISQTRPLTDLLMATTYDATTFQTSQLIILKPEYAAYVFHEDNFYLIGKLAGMDTPTVKLASDIKIEHLWHPVEFIGIGSIDWTIDNVVHRAMRAYIDQRIVGSIKEAAPAAEIIESAATNSEPVTDIPMNDLSDISLFSNLSLLSDGTFPPSEFLIAEETLAPPPPPVMLATYNLVNWGPMIAQMAEQPHDFKIAPSKFPAVQFALVTELECARKHFEDYIAYVLREERNFRLSLAYLIRLDLWAHNSEDITPIEQPEGVYSEFLLSRLNEAMRQADSIKGKAADLKEIADSLPLTLLPTANRAILEEFSQMSLQTRCDSDIMRFHTEIDELMNRELYSKLDANFARIYAVKEKLCIAMSKNLL